MIIIWGECFFRILKKKQQKKPFCLSHLNECPELLCGLSCDLRWGQTIPMGNSPWETRKLQGITISLWSAILWVVWWPGRSCTLRRGQVLVFINRHNPTMNFVEEKQRGLVPLGLQSWLLQLSEHLTNTTSVAPPPAGPAGCRPLYLLHLLNLSFTIRAPNGCCIFQFRAYQNFVCNLLSTPRCKSQVPSKET